MARYLHWWVLRAAVLLAIATLPFALPFALRAERRPVLLKYQTITSSFFNGIVAVDASNEVALLGLNNGTVAVTTLRSYGAWSTGLTIRGATANFGLGLALENGWALISEDQSARTVRSYAYVAGEFQPKGVILGPLTQTDAAFGYRIALSDDARIAAVSAFDYDDPALPGDDHGIVYVYERQGGGTWSPIQSLTAGGLSRTNGKFGYSMALSGDGRRLVVGHIGAASAHVFDRNSITGAYSETQVLSGPLPLMNGFGWDVDITDDGESILVGIPMYSGNRGAGFIFRRDTGTWTVVNGLSPYSAAHGLGWSVGLSDGLAVLGTMNYQGAPSPTTALLAWSNDLDAVSQWNTSVAPDTVDFEPTAARLDIAIDGRWVFMGSLSVRSLPQVVVFSVFSPPALATVTLDRTSLAFGAISAGSSFLSQTSTQVVRLSQSGGAPVSWTASPEQPWLTVSPSSGTGPADLSIGLASVAGLPASGTLTGSINLSMTGARNTPGPIAVTLSIAPGGSSGRPFGVIDTPLEGSTGVTGAIPVTGWALDDVEVVGVSVCRDPVPAETPAVDARCGGTSRVFLGDAVFLDGARPDVQGVYPGYPRSSRAGWGFMVLTNMLPDIGRGLPTGGNGTFLLAAYARDREGHVELLRTRTMSCDNEHATAPFGTIDTPTQGGLASTTNYVNFGWVLTPHPKFVPFDGSTITVFVDGVPVGSASYNHFRSDIATLFPGFANSNGAVGYRIIDTTTLSNGLHTIAWSVSDSDGTAAGIGSRYFTVANGTTSAVPATASAMSSGSVPGQGAEQAVRRRTNTRTSEGTTVPAERLEELPLVDAPIIGRRGWDQDGPWQAYRVDGDGRTIVRGEELDRFELRLGEAGDAVSAGYLRVGKQLRPLPIGSSLDPATGVFTWQPGVGFVGRYDLVFMRSEAGQFTGRQEVRIVLAAKGHGKRGR